MNAREFINHIERNGGHLTVSLKGNCLRHRMLSEEQRRELYDPEQPRPSNEYDVMRTLRERRDLGLIIHWLQSRCTASADGGSSVKNLYANFLLWARVEINESEFRSALEQLGYECSDTYVEKLWLSCGCREHPNTIDATTEQLMESFEANHLFVRSRNIFAALKGSTLGEKHRELDRLKEEYDAICRSLENIEGDPLPYGVPTGCEEFGPSEGEDGDPF